MRLTWMCSVSSPPSPSHPQSPIPIPFPYGDRGRGREGKEMEKGGDSRFTVSRKTKLARP